MNNLIKYYEFISEKYNFEIINNPSPFRIQYTFTNRDNIKFNVIFTQFSKYWEREYSTTLDTPFAMLEKPDSINVIATITAITIDFLNKNKPNAIIIPHISSKKEKQKDNYDSNSEIQRLIANRRFLTRELSSDYMYTNDGSSSIITKRTS